jgi:hypothetical protein
MIDFLMLLACVLTRLFRSSARLEAEILVLRHELNILQRRSTERAAFKSINRLVFAGLYRLVPDVLDALKIATHDIDRPRRRALGERSPRSCRRHLARVVPQEAAPGRGGGHTH